MNSIIERLQKRRCCEVKVNGDSFYVRALTIQERRQIDSIDEPLLKSWFALGCGLCDADGKSEFARDSGKSPSDFAKEIEAACSVGDGIPTDTFRELCDTINKLGLVPKQDLIQKN